MLAALAIALQWLAPSIPLVASLDHLVGDRLHEVLASGEPENRVVVVDLDESSIAAYGAWPWPRARVADLLDALAGNYGARMVGVDIVFPSAGDAAGDARIAALADFAPLALAQALDFVERTPAVTSGVPVFDAPRVRGDAPGVAATGYLANHAGLAQAKCVGNIGLQPDSDGRVRRVPLLATWAGRSTPL
ncbi:MAG TPA: CHASE2 domain-containing protein, partial [Ramlibacter sp.]